MSPLQNGIYSQPVVSRVCACDTPHTYVDDDGDVNCMKCGRPTMGVPIPEFVYDTAGRRIGTSS